MRKFRPYMTTQAIPQVGGRHYRYRRGLNS